jgi:hypothetical protein
MEPGSAVRRSFVCIAVVMNCGELTSTRVWDGWGMASPL